MAVCVHEHVVWLRTTFSSLAAAGYAPSLCCRWIRPSSIFIVSSFVSCVIMALRAFWWTRCHWLERAGGRRPRVTHFSTFHRVYSRNSRVSSAHLAALAKVSQDDGGPVSKVMDTPTLISDSFFFNVIHSRATLIISPPVADFLPHFAIKIRPS